MGSATQGRASGSVPTDKKGFRGMGKGGGEGRRDGIGGGTKNC